MSNLVYGIVIFRTDGNHISVLEDPNYDKCFDCWKKVQMDWATAVKEQQPFILTNPIVTAFSPSLIYEIKLIPVNTKENVAKSNNNPYYAQMNEQGFSKSFSNNVDLLQR